ncbi:hypothetical protein Tco_1236174 [Tanacetum coccineum]
MAALKFANTHNMVAFLEKPTESSGFEEIVDFLNAHPIRYALTVNPAIYVSCIEQFWSTAKAKTINEETQIHALVDGKKIVITESSVRNYLQFPDEDGFVKLPKGRLLMSFGLSDAWGLRSGFEGGNTIGSNLVCYEHRALLKSGGV